MTRRGVAALVVWALVGIACGGHAVLVRTASEGPDSAQETTGPAVVTASGSKNPHQKTTGSDDTGTTSGTNSPDGTGGGGGAGRCATTSNPSQGFTEDTIRIGTILPLSGPLRPLGEQLRHVIEVMSEEVLATQDNVPGPLGHLNWDCPGRPGIFGRRIDVDIYSLNAQTPEEALAGMRRLIDVKHVFLVRDCYLQDSIMGPATQYQNANGVPGIWCHYGDMPVPSLAPWNYNPGIDPHTQAAIHIGYLIRELDRERIAVLADPTDQDGIVRVVQQVAARLGHPIPDDCIEYTRSQEASSGMESQIASIRTCYGAGTSPDAVFAADALQAVFGALEAESQGWRGADNGVQWACTNPSCWVTALAELCRDACEGMITDCATLPCVPWADPDRYPSVRNFRNTKARWFPGEPDDGATYGPMAISTGIALWLTMVGPDLSREKFRETVGSLRNWTAGIGPVINMSSGDHYGARAQWLIRYTGRPPWFDDVTGDFITLDDVGVPEAATRT